MQEATNITDNPGGGPVEGCTADPATAVQIAELDSRLVAYEVDKNRGRPAADVLADVRRRLQGG